MKKCIFIVATAFLVATWAWAEEVEAPSNATEDLSVDAHADETHRYFFRFSGFEPLYGSFGWRERVNAKVQLSFKYRFLNVDPDNNLTGNWFNQFYFGYTQTTLWDLESDSAPFYDTSYKPSFFFLRERVALDDERRWALSFQTGVEHESNGQGGDDSRSLNIVYVKPIFRVAGIFGGRLTVAPKMYAYVGGLSDNRDMADYRGYVDLEVAWKDEDGWKLAAMMRKGTEGSYGSIQVDASYPLDRIFHGSFDAFAHLQYFNGWGESLLSYDQKLPAQFRVGLMLVR